MTRCALLVVTLALSAGLCGCLPNTVTIGLGPGDTTLRSTTVLEDDRAGRDSVAMIELRGVIADAPQPAFVGTRPSLIDHLVQRLEEAEKDDDVKAVILRINSPGGTVTGSDIMYAEIRRFRERTGKPVVVSMGEVAASGGYYISLAGDEIFAEPTTITGSIGVIFATINVSEGLNRIGVHARAVTSGPNKNMGNPLETPRSEHYEILQGIVDEFYVSFRGLVLERRTGIDPDEVDTLTDGRIVTGATAAAMGLVDDTGGIREAFERAKALAGVERARLIRYHTGRRGPKTAYAQAPVPVPEAQGRQEISAIRLDLGGSAPILDQPVAYYLWLPGMMVR